jgi:hypothetical protein
LTTKRDKNNVFAFHKTVYQIELTGKTAKNLKEFVENVKKIDNMSLFYHLHHSLLDHHLVPPEYPNDFAYWIADALQETELAERLSMLEIGKIDNIDTLRKKIVNIVETHLQQNGIKNVHEGSEFHFLGCIAIILPTRYSVRDLKQFKIILKMIDTKSIFYHLFASKFFFKHRTNDFSSWLAQINCKKTADMISKVDPYDYTNLNDVRKKLLEILEDTDRIGE